YFPAGGGIRDRELESRSRAFDGRKGPGRMPLRGRAAGLHRWTEAARVRATRCGLTPADNKTPGGNRRPIFEILRQPPGVVALLRHDGPWKTGSLRAAKARDPPRHGSFLVWDNYRAVFQGESRRSAFATGRGPGDKQAPLCPIGSDR